ncbi:DUF2326 domain-containing protein [Nocardia abscessus]|uniref:DUF2326 domain-containing protein n=1 Tax=Nocardia abscessus TaxID=120957 RepID=A0ABS0C2Y1_9NOCA|nr:DUF2326 domain-containing protein [Nocardia abscessus]MBF6224739.1 DUF2326 domain-containing protein [Nocardia abscessus]
MEQDMRLIALRANKEHFRTVLFKPGLNLVVAERTAASSDKDSRNGVGKTTLFQAIDFCFGGSVKGSDGLTKLKGSDWEFSLELEFDRKRRLTVTRALDNSGEIVLDGEVLELGLGGRRRTESIGVRSWTDWLGSQCFELNNRDIRGEYDPTFRRLIGHFLRFRNDAYISPFETFAKQPPYQVQVDNAYLIGLNWRLATEWQRWKDRGKALGAMAKSDMDELGEKLGELESRRVRAEAQHRRLVEQIRAFQVLPEYREIESRANGLTARIQKIANEMTVNARMLSLYREQLESEEPGDIQGVIETFEGAGVIFGKSLRRNLDEIVQFHTAVSRNRREYLQSEVTKLEISQLEREAEIARLDAAKRADLSLLQSHGALDDFANLQQRVGTTAALIESLVQQIEELREIRKGKAALKVAQVELQQRTALDVDERMSSLAPVLEDFSGTFEELYGGAADLVVDVGDAGYQFRSTLPRQGSHGVGKIGIFAYDLAIANNWSRTNRGPGFLAHDSVVFDGVDERQTAAAISKALRSADEIGYQYLLTINSDDLPVTELTARGVDVKSSTVLTLTDVDPKGGLLGIRI